jgi:hypothetical protein
MRVQVVVAINAVVEDVVEATKTQLSEAEILATGVPGDDRP